MSGPNQEHDLITYCEQPIVHTISDFMKSTLRDLDESFLITELVYDAMT